jgi:hypothetical protein
MDKYALLLGYFDKQISIIERLYREIIVIDLSIDDKQSSFALKTQQFYTALEDLFKQIAKSFENHIENMSNFHKEMLYRMNTEVPKIRPAVLSNQSLVLLDKIRAFRHFIRHAYDCELDEKELRLIQDRLAKEYSHAQKDLQNFRLYIQKLAKT